MCTYVGIEICVREGVSVYDTDVSCVLRYSKNLILF